MPLDGGNLLIADEEKNTFLQMNLWLKNILNH